MATVMALVGLSGIASSASAAPTVAKVKGSGVDDNELAFEFRAKDPANPSGEAFFETNSFGDPTGQVNCLNVKRRKAAISGTIDNPTSGLTHFMMIMKDNHRKAGDPPDLVTTWMRNGPFDCQAEAFGDLDNNMQDVIEGRLRVTP